MKTATAALVISILAATAVAPLGAAEEPPALSHNPFSRPSSEIVRGQQLVVENGDSGEPVLPLHATMVGRVNRLANVAGRILKPGDEYQGFRLIEIHERYAVFQRDGRNVTVYVKPLLAEDNE